VQAGLYTAGFLSNGMTSQEGETAGIDCEVESMGFHRFTLGPARMQGLLLGFAAFNETAIR
jgi:hypothetical protein